MQMESHDMHLQIHKLPKLPPKITFLSLSLFPYWYAIILRSLLGPWRGPYYIHLLSYDLQQLFILFLKDSGFFRIPKLEQWRQQAMYVFPQTISRRHNLSQDLNQCLLLKLTPLTQLVFLALCLSPTLRGPPEGEKQSLLNWRGKKRNRGRRDNTKSWGNKRDRERQHIDTKKDGWTKLKSMCLCMGSVSLLASTCL